MANVIICSAAEVDYTESLRWYAERSAEAANDFDTEFDRAILHIARDPERFPMCDSRHRYFLLRRFPFRIIYRIVGSGDSCNRCGAWVTFSRLLGQTVTHAAQHGFYAMAFGTPSMFGNDRWPWYNFR